jgi:hypothetical protein
MFFPKFRNHLKISVARYVTRSKFLAEVPQIFLATAQKVVARRNLVLGDLCTHPSGAHEIRELCKRKTSCTNEWKNFFQNFGTTSKFQSPEK